MRPFTTIRVQFLAALIVAAICSAPVRAGSPPPSAAKTVAASSAGTASAAVARPAALPAPWKEMNLAQRRKYMKAEVSPKMKVLFQKYDASTFKKFGCETCHGQDGPDQKYKMPSSDVHPLPATPQAFEAMLKKKPEWPRWTKFMSEQVVPHMAGLLGLAVFNPKNSAAGGFSCQACHTLK